MASRTGVALIGMGNMGIIHMKNCIMSPRVDLRWVVRNQLEQGKKMTAAYNLPTQCTTPDKIDDVLDDDRVDAVIICSPTDTHKDLIQKSLHAGKHILAEKPITPEVGSTIDCYALAEKVKKTLLCGFHRRFDPSFSQVKENVQNTVLGNLRFLKVSSHDQKPPTLKYIKTSAGILSDSTIHDLDMSLWLTGSKPTSVYVQSTAFDEEVAKYDSDLVVVTVMFENGVISVIDNGRQASYGYHQELEVFCDRGAFRVTNRPTTQLHTYGSEQSLSPQIDQHFSTRYTEAYKLEMEHFIDVLQGKCEVQVKKDDVISVCKLLEACKESKRLKEPIKL